MTPGHVCHTGPSAPVKNLFMSLANTSSNLFMKFRVFLHLTSEWNPLLSNQPVYSLFSPEDTVNVNLNSNLDFSMCFFMK
jgi:hypothetical protein